jgi:PmbA protein
VTELGKTPVNDPSDSPNQANAMTDQFDQNQLRDQASSLVEAARKAGADAADAIAVRGISLGVDVRLGKVEETERSESDDFSLRVFVGRRTASVSANRLQEIDELASRAVSMARAAPEDPFAALAQRDQIAGEIVDLDLLDSQVPNADQLTADALEAENAALEVDGVTNSGGASSSWRLGGLVLATSAGFVGSYLASRHGTSVTAIAGDGVEMERDYDFSSAVYRRDVTAARKLGKQAGSRAVRRLNPRKVDSQLASVVFESRLSGGLVGHLAGAINGASVARGSSFLKDRMGQRLFAPEIRIVDDPTIARGLASRPFDGEGLVADPMTVIDGGDLQCWLLDIASAAELQLSPNGRASRGGANPSPSSTNMYMEAGARTPEQLIGEINNGLLVTDLIGHGVNLVTGDYSRGVAGLWIENGQIAFPVSEITIASTLDEMFTRLVPADDLTFRFAVNAPTIAIEGMTIAGK